MAITVTHIDGEGAKPEVFKDALGFNIMDGSLYLYRDTKGTQPLIVYAPQVWLTAEVSDG